MLTDRSGLKYLAYFYAYIASVSLMRGKLLAVLVAAVALVQSFNQWLGEQAYLTLREVRELGFAHRFERVIAAMVGGDPMDNRGQLGFQTILAALVVVIAVFLGIVIVDQMNSSLGSPTDGNLSDAKNDTLSGFSDMTSLVAPLLLVAIAVVIIGLLRRVS